MLETEMSELIHFNVTGQDLKLIAPLLWIGATAFIVLVIDLFRIDRANKNFAFTLSWAGIIVAFMYNVFLMTQDIKHQAAFGGLIQCDQVALIFNALILISALLAVLHFVWLVKSDIREPLLYGAVVVILLVLRIPRVRRSVSHFRSWLKRNVYQKFPSAYHKAQPTTDA